MIYYLIVIGLLLIACIIISLVYNDEKKRGKKRDLLLLATLDLKVDAIVNDLDVIRCLKYKDMVKDAIDLDDIGNKSVFQMIEEKLNSKSRVLFENQKEKDNEKPINEIII